MEAAQRAVRDAVQRVTSAPAWPDGASVSLAFDGFRAVGYELAADHPLAGRAGRRPRVGARSAPASRCAWHRRRTHATTSTSSRCPALCYGPRVRNIHGVDEAVELASIVAGARTLTRFIPEFMTT